MVRFVVIVACVFGIVVPLALAKKVATSNSDAEGSETSHLEAGFSLGGDHGSENGGKGEFSAGSGLRLIAQGSAEQASNAFLNQHLAARQAAFTAKSALAQAAAGASATARTALVGKYILIETLQREVQDAHQQLQAEIQQLEQSERAAATAQEAAQQAQTALNTIASMANAAQGGAAHATEAANAAAAEFGSQAAMVGAAKRRLADLLQQLDSARVDLQATQAAAQQASDSALIAQSNAAQAGEKASENLSLGGGLGGGEIHIGEIHH